MKKDTETLLRKQSELEIINYNDILDEYYNKYKRSFVLTHREEPKDLMYELRNHRMYSDDGKCLVSTIFGHGDDMRIIDLTPKYGTKIICDFAYDEYNDRGNRSLNIPNTVEAIGDKGLYSLYLDRLTIPKSVKYITGNPFSRNKIIVNSLSNYFACENNLLISRQRSLLIAELDNESKSKTTPNNIKIIGRGAYREHYELEFISISEGVEVISNLAFQDCNKLKYILFKGRVRVIESDAFHRSKSIKAIYVPKQLVAHYRNILPADFSEIILTFEINNYSEESLKKAFVLQEDKVNYYKAISSQTYQIAELPVSIQIYIDNYINEFKLSLAEDEDYNNMVIDWGNKENEVHEKWERGIAQYNYNKEKLLEYSGDERFYKIKDGTRIICDYAFYGQRIEKVTFPDTTIVIGNYVFFFADIEKIVIPESVQRITGNPFINPASDLEIECNSPNYLMEHNILYDKHKKIIVSVLWHYDQEFFDINQNPIIIGRNAFCNVSCMNLKTLSLPDSIVYIGKSAFEKSIINNIILSENVRIIDDKSFYDSYFKQIDLPNSVTILGKEAFAYCKNLESIIFSFNIKEIKEKTFEKCEKLDNVIIPEGVRFIRKEAFAWCSSLKNIYIPTTMVEIERDAFKYCSLYSVVLSRRTQIQNDAFPRGCNIIYRD